MKNIQQLIAVEICRVDDDLKPREWLADETSYLGLKFHGLDDMPTLAVLPLSHLAANGISDAQGLALATSIDEDKVEEYMEVLCEYMFVQRCLGGYEATAKGVDAFKAIGLNFITRKRLEVQKRFEYLDSLLRRVGGL